MVLVVHPSWTVHFIQNLPSVIQSMPTIFNPTKLPLSSPLQLKLLLRTPTSTSTSTFPIPTHEHIARLILDQKSPSQALQTFRWAARYPHFTHNQSTYRALIHKLCLFRRFDVVPQLLDEMPASVGSPPDEGVFVTIVRGLGRPRMNRRALGVLDLVSKFHRIMDRKPLMISCSCGSGLMKRHVSKKPNCNKGKVFYRCPKWEDHNGSFFWEAEVLQKTSNFIKNSDAPRNNPSRTTTT